MKRLFLDDNRIPIDCATYMYRFGVDCRIYHEEWIIVRSYKQFVEWIKANGLPDMIAFDHDLADVPELKESLDINEWFDLENNREYTGNDCAKFIVQYCQQHSLELPDCTVHSANPDGKKNIIATLNDLAKMRKMGITMPFTDLWWGYKHVSGTYQAKKYYDERDTQEAEESEFVAEVVYPFEAIDREQALEYIKQQTS